MFEITQKILFRHCDPAGIVFFPRYFEMINDCVEAFFAEALDWPFEMLMQTHGVPTVAIDTAFRAPSRHGDRLTIALVVEKLGTTSMAYRMTGRCGGELRFETRATLVLVDDAGRPHRWPERIRARISEAREGLA